AGVDNPGRAGQASGDVARIRHNDDATVGRRSAAAAECNEPPGGATVASGTANALSEDSAGIRPRRLDRAGVGDVHLAAYAAGAAVAAVRVKEAEAAAAATAAATDALRNDCVRRMTCRCDLTRVDHSNGAATACTAAVCGKIDEYAAATAATGMSGDALSDD